MTVTIASPVGSTTTGSGPILAFPHTVLLGRTGIIELTFTVETDSIIGAEDCKVQVKVGAAGNFATQAFLGWTGNADTILSPTLSPDSAGPKTVKAYVAFREDASSGTITDTGVELRLVNPLDDTDVLHGPRYITLSAEAVDVANVSLVMVLDRSGSMGTLVNGKTRAVRLREAADVCVQLMKNNDQVGIVTFNQDATNEYTLAALGNGAAGTRRAELATLFNTSTLDARLNPSGSTSIGDGLFNADAMYGGATDGNILVFTDGIENTSRFLGDADVMPISTSGTDIYAIGLGDALSVSTTNLNVLTGSTGKYCLITGDVLVTGDQQFRLQKFFYQILIDVKKNDIIVDPEATLTAGAEHFWPFTITEAESGFEAVVFTEHPELVDFDLILPNGAVLDSSIAHLVPGGSFTRGRGVLFFRFEHTIARGIWRGRVRFRGRVDDSDRRDLAEALGGKEHAKEYAAHFARLQAAAPKPGLRYAFLAAAPSSLTFQASLQASGLHVGSEFLLSATILEGGTGIQDRAQVDAQVKLPDGSVITVELDEIFPGRFAYALEALAPGAYDVRFLAKGKTLRGRNYTREALRTGYMLAAGQVPPAPPGVADPGTDPRDPSGGQPGGGRPGTGGPGSSGSGSDPFGVDDALGEIAKKFPELARVLKLCLLCCRDGRGQCHSHCDCSCHWK